ncbi:nitronate monooxygenase [bacterium]|nr:nitronate monooxygenase [bacterium]
MKTLLTELLGIEHPIMLAGMNGVAWSDVVAAVSEAGGCGVLGAEGWPADQLRDECQKVRSLTKKPFGVDFLIAVNDNPIDSVQVAIDEGAEVLVAGLGVPQRIIDMCHEAGLVVMSMAGKVDHAVKAAKTGVDVVIAQGSEAGGHTGAIGSIALWPQVVDAIDVPVLAAGGIVDGRGIVSALAMGCHGVWVGTRFIASKEARAHHYYKQRILESTAADTVISKCWTGKTLRAFRNDTTDFFEKNPDQLKPFPLQVMSMMQEGLLGFALGPDLPDDVAPKSCLPAGQGCGAIKEIKSCKEIIDEMMAQAEAILARGVIPTFGSQQSLLQRRGALPGLEPDTFVGKQ